MEKKQKLYYMDTDNFIVYIKIDNIYKLKQDFMLQTMSQIDHYLKEKTKKVIGLMKNELGGEIMKNFVGSRANTYE